VIVLPDSAACTIAATRVVGNAFGISQVANQLLLSAPLLLALKAALSHKHRYGRTVFLLCGTSGSPTTQMPPSVVPLSRLWCYVCAWFSPFAYRHMQSCAKGGCVGVIMHLFDGQARKRKGGAFRHFASAGGTLQDQWLRHPT
jgi:hypothetical protein